MWRHYQPAILKCIFMPFVIYMSLFVTLCSTNAGSYLSEVGEDSSKEKHSSKTLMVVLTVCISILWLFFLALEIGQMCMSRLAYLSDPWNWVDLTSLGLNLSFLIMINVDLFTNQQHFSISWVRTCGALCCFVLWIKVFYWMRLFRTAAHFITLIRTTIYDIRVFSIMLLIIIIAFSNIFFVLNNNIKDRQKAGSSVYNPP